MKVLVTGAGLVGSHAAAQLINGGHSVVLYDLSPDAAYVRSVVGSDAAVLERGDIANLPALTEIMLREKPEAVVHTVGLIGSVAQSRPFAGFTVNVVGSVNVAEAARLAGARRVIYASTHGVYDADRCKDGPITEASPTRAKAMYAGSKLAAEAMLQAYGVTYALDVLVIRFCNLFGRGAYRAGSRGGEAFNELVEEPARGRTTTIRAAVRGTGEWLYAKDVGRALAAAAESPNPFLGTIINVGSGVLSREEDLLDAVRQSIPDARFDRPDDGTERSTERAQAFDLRKARELLHFEPSYTLASAVADYVDEIRTLSPS